MLNVRNTGQLPRNQEELEILQRLGASCNVDIKDAVFEYRPKDAPLSWHLSPNDKKQIEESWTSDTAQPKQTVHTFLAAAPPLPETTPLPSACR
jgi:hypothetical protein